MSFYVAKIDLTLSSNMQTQKIHVAIFMFVCPMCKLGKLHDMENVG